MHKIYLYVFKLLLLVSLVACDELSGYEKTLAQSVEWPQKINGSFYLLDSDLGDGKYAYWAIGTFEPSGTNESILIEFNGETLKKAGIDLEFNYSNPISITVNPPINMYFQVVSILSE